MNFFTRLRLRLGRALIGRENRGTLDNATRADLADAISSMKPKDTPFYTAMMSDPDIAESQKRDRHHEWTTKL